jgi:mannose-6-phosphate isomerase
LVDCSYFFTNILKFDKPIEKDYNLIDSFVIYIATEGSFQISYENKITKVQMGECVLIPAVLKNLILEPNGYAELIEVYVK